MSIFFPYNPSDVISSISDLFTIDLTSLTSFESTLLTLFCNLYFIIFWFIITYISIKIFNRIWERLF